MLINLRPQAGLDYRPGDTFFTRRPDSLLSDGIDWFTRGDATGLVATHTGIVVKGGKVVEALPAGMVETDFAELLADPDVLVWVKTPAGQTPESAEWICKRIRSHKNKGYDWLGLVLFKFGIHSAKDLFCSESVAQVLSKCPYLDWVIPDSPHDWSPQRLNAHPTLWRN